MSDRKNRWVATSVLLAGLLFTAGCASTAAEETKENPAQVEPIAGTDRSQVTLTQEGAGRVGIQTQPIGVAADGSGSMIALAAVLYDKDGRTWTYTTSKPLTFVPQEVVIARIDGDTAILTSGPAPGTEVVTVGAAELLGAEYGVPGECPPPAPGGDALDRRDQSAISVYRGRDCPADDGRRIPAAGEDAGGCVPGVRTPAGGNPDHVQRPVDRRRRIPGHRPARTGAQRHRGNWRTCAPNPFLSCPAFN